AAKDKSPGTAPKAVAMLRAELVKASEYAQKRAKTDPEKRAARDLHLEALGPALEGKQPLLVTVNRHQDIVAALRVAAEFKLKQAGILFALQSGYEGYVPKTRVVLLEAGVAAANGLSFTDALASITSDAARLLGIAERVGTLEKGKDADIALYDGDPFEYTT